MSSYDDLEKAVPIIQTTKELGLAIRSRRKELGWDQAKLATQAGVTRQWIIDIEKGKPRAELALTMRALRVLGLTLTVDAKTRDEGTLSRSDSREGRGGAPSMDIDAIVERNRMLADPMAKWLPKTAADYLKELDLLRSSPGSLAIDNASAQLLREAESITKLEEASALAMPTTAADYLKKIDQSGALDDLTGSAASKAANQLTKGAASIEHIAGSLVPKPPKTAAECLADMGASGEFDQMKAAAELFPNIDPLMMPSRPKRRKS